MKILRILNDVQQGIKSAEDAEGEIKVLMGAILDDSSVGIGSFDATEMYGEIEKALQSL